MSGFWKTKLIVLSLNATKAKAEYAPYYKNSLLYLACVNPETDISPEDRLVRAHDLGISALLGETIYNFGELVRSKDVLLSYLFPSR